MRDHPPDDVDLNGLPADPTWPTQRQDLRAAAMILRRHAAAGKPLRLLEAWGEDDEERIWVRFPAWIIDLARHFQHRYGDHGDVIVRRVLAALLPLDPPRLH